MRLNWRGAALLVTILATARTPAHAIGQDGISDRDKYAGDQRLQVQKIRQINNNLVEAIPPLAGTQEDAFRDALRNGTRPGAPNFQALQDGLRWEIYKATDPAYKTNQPGFQALNKRLRQNILYIAGQGIGGRREKEEFRELVCSQALVFLKDLLSNNFLARSLAIELMPALETNTDARQRRILDAAADALIEVLADEQQPDAIKLRAAESIALYLENVDPGAQIEIRFALAIQEELKSSLPADAYQLHLIEALSRIRAAREVIGVNQRAVVLDSLVAALQDADRAPVVRCSAAGALGSAGIDQRIALEPLAWKVAQLSAQMGAAYNKKPKYDFWGKCSLELFLAFHHKEEPPRGEQPEDGMLNRAARSELVRNAYAHVLPICREILDSPSSIDAAIINAAASWTEQNQPSDLRYDAESPPVKP